jgi:hypothetical protein
MPAFARIAERMSEDPRHTDAHRHSIYHRAEIEQSSTCGCFGCLQIFPSHEIAQWCDKNLEEASWTALCPYCEIDSVIGSNSGFPIEPAFLSALNQRFFGFRT